MTHAETRARAQALLAEAETYEADLPPLRAQEAEAYEALSLARAIGNAALIAGQEQALAHAQQNLATREQQARVRRQDAEALLAALVA